MRLIVPSTLSVHRMGIAATLFLIGAAGASTDPPAGYYDSATGTGAALESQLQSIMSTGHLQRTYGDFRFSAAISDRDPGNPDNILLVYNRASVDSTWNLNNTLPWNREHVWPVSRQPGSVSNSSTGNLGDPHALRPADTQINGDRGNDPYGFAATTGTYGSVGSFFFPGDADKGDVARSLFYSSTRYNLGLVNGTPGTNQMGDLESLVAWHYLDPPDDFERRRNHVIYSQAENPQYYTNNRNAYVDRPEFVWSVFVDQSNDSRLYVGDSPDINGQSIVNLDFGAAIVGADVTVTPQVVSLNKDGFDGTYYEVWTTGPATSSVSGRNNAFAINDTGSDSRPISVGMDIDTGAAGELVGNVVIDNLDVTRSGGSGRGGLDNRDWIVTRFDVLDHANASFADSADTNELTIDFGEVAKLDDVVGVFEEFSLFNLEATSGFTAGLDFDGFFGTGDTDVFSLDLAPFTGLAAGDEAMFQAVVNEEFAVGTYTATYTLSTSDEDVPGATAGDPLTLTLIAELVLGEPFVIPGDFNGNGLTEQGDLNLVLSNWGAAFDAVSPGWLSQRPTEGIVDQAELNAVLNNWGGQSSPSWSSDGVPEPAVVGLIALVGVVSRRRRATRV